MEEIIIQQLNAVVGSLNCINVSGKSNLGNLYASIQVLEQAIATLTQVKNEAEARKEEKQ